jgi:hypothetical protein
MPCDMMDLAPLLYVIRAPAKAFFFLIQGLLATIFVISMILAISSVSCVDFPIVLLLLRGPFVAGLKKSSPGVESLNAYICDCE